MTAATSRLRRRGIGAGVAALVGLSGLGFAAMPAQAAAGFNPAATQVSGVDRFDTAAQIATKAFTTATTVVVANGDRAIDAQAGAYVAGLNNAPILLTQKSNVPTFTVDAIKKLGATKAIVLGDSNSVDATALAQMTAAGLTVTVVAGADRFETAADIYNLGTTKSSTVFLARADLLAGQVSPDALAASPLSYDGTPVLLTNAASLPQATADAIKNGGVKNVVVLGNAITDAVKTAVTALGATVTTIAGDDRSLTAQKIADYGIAQGKYMKTTATIANGDKIDALAAGPWAAKNMAPILLTLGTNSLGTGTTNYLTANAATLTTGVAFGDTNSVPASLTTAAKTAGGGDAAALQSLNVTPGAAATLTVADESGTTPTSDDRVYTVTGLTDATQYRVTLVKAANVTVANGATTFAIDRTAQTVTSTNPDGANGQQASGNYLASAGTVAAAFGSVNGGTPVNNTGVGTGSATVTNSAVANPVNGSITFTVDGSAPDSVVPVVYLNGGTGRALTAGGTSARLEVNAQGAPVESFGLGGAVTYINPAAASQTVSSAATIASVNKTTNQFDAANKTFTYKTGDTFSIGGVPATLDEFEAALSSGDTFTGAYSATTAASTFALTDANPTAPSAVTAVAGSTGNATNDITVTATLAAGLDYDSVVIQRALVTGSTVGTFATIASPTTDADAATSGFQYVDTDVAVGTYRYQVAVVNDGQQTAFTANTTDATSTTPAADTTGPIPTATAVVTDGGFAGILDAGDSFTIQADEALALPAAGSIIRVTDNDTSSSTAVSSVADLVIGTNATVSLNAAAIPSTATANAGAAANTVLTVRVTAAPTVVTAGTTAGVAYPATITNTSGVNDVAGNRLNLAGTGADTVIS